jgi:hypothetical protein
MIKTMKFSRLSIGALCVFLLYFSLIINPVLAAPKIGFVNNNIWLSKDAPVQGDKLKVYVVIVNSDDNDIEGKVTFYDNGSIFGGPAGFSLSAGSSQVKAANWTASIGNHQFRAVISDMKSKTSSSTTPLSGNVETQTSIIYVEPNQDVIQSASSTPVSSGSGVPSAATSTSGNGSSDNVSDVDTIDAAAPKTATVTPETSKPIKTSGSSTTRKQSVNDASMPDIQAIDLSSLATGSASSSFDESLNSAASSTEYATDTEQSQDTVGSIQDMPAGDTVLGDKIVNNTAPALEAKGILPMLRYLTSNVIVKILGALSLIFLISALVFFIFSKRAEQKYAGKE